MRSGSWNRRSIASSTRSTRSASGADASTDDSIRSDRLRVRAGQRLAAGFGEFRERVEYGGEPHARRRIEQARQPGAHRARRIGIEREARRRAPQQRAQRRIFGAAVGDAVGPVAVEPHDERDFGRGAIDARIRRPGVRQVRRDEHQIVVRVAGDVIADEAPAAAVQRERQFVFRMPMPFERNACELAVIHADRAAGSVRHVFVLRLHRGLRATAASHRGMIVVDRHDGAKPCFHMFAWASAIPHARTISTRRCSRNSGCA
jgi:hypothetical protein